MKVPFNQTVEVEGDVDVSLDDIRSALLEYLHSAKGDERDPAPPNKRDVCGFVNHAYVCLSAVTDEMIDVVGKNARGVIADALAKESARWRIT